jgi:hypothetical protein
MIKKIKELYHRVLLSLDSNKYNTDILDNNTQVVQKATDRSSEYAFKMIMQNARVHDIIKENERIKLEDKEYSQEELDWFKEVCDKESEEYMSSEESKEAINKFYIEESYKMLDIVSNIEKYLASKNIDTTQAKNTYKNIKAILDLNVMDETYFEMITMHLNNLNIYLLKIEDSEFKNLIGSLRV